MKPSGSAPVPASAPAPAPASDKTPTKVSQMEHKLHLIGPGPYIQHFYESNRITKEDVALFPSIYPKQRDLCFDKAVSRLLSNILELDEDHPTTDIWGSYGDAFEVKSKMVKGANSDDPAHLYYTFKTKQANSTPFQWLRVVSKKYAVVEFTLDCSDGISYAIQDGVIKKKRKEGESDEEFLKKSVKKLAAFFEKNKIQDYPKRMKKIYDRHMKEAAKSSSSDESMDLFGVIEDFIEKYEEIDLYDFMSEPNMYGEDLEDLEPLSKEFIKMVIGISA